ncbi:MAG: polysaccharide deacetylase [Chryseobacterium sp.]|nr:MAG: polysaccharide deacetylase [Chryseobacterium sp.]
MIVLSVLLVLAIFSITYFRLYLFVVPKNRLTILMYHQIEKNSTEKLTISPENLEKQFSYLKDNGFNSIFFSEINLISRKKIILTFDDGYENNLQYLPSLLEKYNLKATIFIATEFIQKGYRSYKMMTFEDIRNLDREKIEIALHSHHHENFRNSTMDFIENDLIDNMLILDKEGITYSKILAYPYGGYPKDNQKKSDFFLLLKKIGIEFAVRIGNRINYFPTQKPYELCRIDIKGDESLIKFKLKVIFGRLKPF